jgi:RHS repeat-associated protein
VIQTTGTTGQQENSFLYEPFGSLIGWNYSSFWPTRLFGGEETDMQTPQMSESLVYLRSRYYDPFIGRFTSRDSAKVDTMDTQGLNKYCYVENNPLSRIDPSGKSWWWPGLYQYVYPVYQTALHVVLNGAAVVPYGIYYAAYRAQKTLNLPMTSPNPFVQTYYTTVHSTLANLQRVGLAGDMAIDQFKSSTLHIDESVRDEGSFGYINPFWEFVPSWLRGPQIYLYGVHQNGSVDFIP